jgi:formate hydrogenlyase transcriptional activator
MRGRPLTPSSVLRHGRSTRVTQLVSYRDNERSTIIAALKAVNGKIGGRDGAAERLGLKRTTLLNKMRKLNITVQRSATVKKQ